MRWGFMSALFYRLFLESFFALFSVDWFMHVFNEEIRRSCSLYFYYLYLPKIFVCLIFLSEKENNLKYSVQSPYNLQYHSCLPDMRYTCHQLQCVKTAYFYRFSWSAIYHHLSAVIFRRIFILARFYFKKNTLIDLLNQS